METESFASCFSKGHLQHLAVKNSNYIIQSHFTLLKKTKFPDSFCPSLRQSDFLFENSGTESEIRTRGRLLLSLHYQHCVIQYRRVESHPVTLSLFIGSHSAGTSMREFTIILLSFFNDILCHCVCVCLGFFAFCVYLRYYFLIFEFI